MNKQKINIALAIILIVGGFMICVVDIFEIFWQIVLKTFVGYLMFYLGLKKLDKEFKLQG